MTWRTSLLWHDLTSYLPRFANNRKKLGIVYLLTNDNNTDLAYLKARSV